MDWASLNASLPREALETGKRARSNVILQQEWDAAVSELNWDELILNKWAVESKVGLAKIECDGAANRAKSFF